MLVKPNENKKLDNEVLKVYDPVHGDFLPNEGRNVPNNPYWMRRLATGEVVKINEIIKQKSNIKPKE